MCLILFGHTPGSGTPASPLPLHCHTRISHSGLEVEVKVLRSWFWKDPMMRWWLDNFGPTSLGLWVRTANSIITLQRSPSFLELLSLCTSHQLLQNVLIFENYNIIDIHIPFLCSRDVRADVHAYQPGGTKAAQRQELNLARRSRLEADGLKLLRFRMLPGILNVKRAPYIVRFLPYCRCGCS